MKEWLKRWKPKDVIALVLLIGAFTLRGLGINSFTETIIIVVAGGYGIWTAKDVMLKGRGEDGKRN